MSGSDSDHDSEAPVNLDGDGSDNETYDPNATEISIAEGKVVKKILRAGAGATPPVGAKVDVHYVGRLQNGTQFDSSRSRNSPFSFTLGKGQVIKGWDKGLATMKKGELAELTIQPDYGYGSSGSGDIPPNAVLIFEVELLDWSKKEKVTSDGGVMKETITSVNAYKRPNDGSLCTVTYTARLEGSEKPFEEKKNFALRIGEDFSVLPGIEEGLKSMNVGEKARFTFAPRYGYGAVGNAALGVPPNAVLDYEIELTQLEKAKESWEMSTDEKIECMHKKKNQGNELFKLDRLQDAIKKYDGAISAVRYDDESKWNDEQKKQINAGIEVCNNNLAQCHLKLKNYSAAIAAADEVLKRDARNVKALFRRAQAYYATNDFPTAVTDLSAAAHYEPSNDAVKKLLAQVKGKIKEQADRERQLFSGMFSRVSLVGDEHSKSKGSEQKEKKAATDSTPSEGQPRTEANSGNHAEKTKPAAEASASKTEGTASMDVDKQ